MSLDAHLTAGHPCPWLADLAATLSNEWTDPTDTPPEAVHELMGRASE